MKKLLTMMLTVLFVLTVSTSVFAGGGGPPKNILKGTFTQVDKAHNTAIFTQDDSGKTLTLSLGSSMTAAEVPLNKKVMVNLDKKAGEGVIKDISVMFMDMTLNKIIALIIVGLVGGLLSGFIGSGGAFVLTPAMMSLGVPGAVAVASNMCHKFPKAMVGAYKRFKYGQVDLKLALVMAVTAIIGVQIGVKIQKFILNHWGNAGSNLYVSVTFVVVLVVVGFYVFVDAFKLSKGDGEEKVPKLALTMREV